MTYWRLKGRELANCNCEYGCNCQFGGLPDKGNCQAVFAMDIEEGNHGDTDLSGLKIKRPKIEVTDENVQQAMTNLREQQDLTEIARSLREHGRNAIWVASDLLKGTTS